MINGNFKGKDILSLDQFTPKDLLRLFTQAKKMRSIVVKNRPAKMLAGYVVTLLFYEPSSRTFGSFSSAVKRLGGQTIDVQNPQTVSSVAKGESLEDTVRTFESYSDAIVMRHPEVGSAKKAADAAKIPIINAGDGVGEHPTQALYDLYTIYKRFLRLDNLTVVFGGDMRHGRTVHSLIRGLSLFRNNTAVLLSPRQLQLKREDFSEFASRGIRLVQIERENQIPKTAHVWYWTRVQKERFTHLADYERVKHRFIVTKKLLNRYGNKTMLLMHPLPRVGEIDTEVDSDERAVYLSEQMRNGLYVRMALLSLVLGKVR